MPAIKPVSYRVLVKVFEQDGFTFDRQKGDHLIYTKPNINQASRRYSNVFQRSRVHHKKPASHGSHDKGTVFRNGVVCGQASCSSRRRWRRAIETASLLEVSYLD